MDERNTENYEIWLTCSSEATDASISCGCEGDYTQEEINDLHGIVNNLIQSFADSFWENHYEFDDGIQVAQKLSSINNNISFFQALRIVFEHFTFSLQINGKPIILPQDIDADETIYPLLEIG